jgi:hypothetical protein
VAIAVERSRDLPDPSQDACRSQCHLRHPAAAGVQADLVEVLCGAGASPNGLDDDGRPLWEAIKSGYTPAAERLIHCGAQVDNLLFAAALGNLAAVNRYFDGEGALVVDRARDWGKAHCTASTVITCWNMHSSAPPVTGAAGS